MAVDYFLKLDGIDGESADSNHKNEIQIMSWSWGAANVSSVAGTGGSGAGKVSLGDFTIMNTLIRRLLSSSSRSVPGPTSRPGQ